MSDFKNCLGTFNLINNEYYYDGGSESFAGDYTYCNFNKGIQIIFPNCDEINNVNWNKIYDNEFCENHQNENPNSHIEISLEDYDYIYIDIQNNNGDSGNCYFEIR